MKFKISRHMAIKSLITPKRIICFLCLASVLILIINIYGKIVTDASLPPIKNEAVNVITDHINRSVDDYLSKNPDFSKKCFTAALDNNGKTISYSVNSAYLAEAERQIITALTESLKKSKVLEVMIPVGTLTNIKFFSAKGFPVTVKAYMSSSVTSSTGSTIESVGINQSLYKILLTTNITCELMFQGKSEVINVSSARPLAEKIIIGGVPLD